MTEPQFSPTQNASVPYDERVTYFGLTDSRNQKTPFGIKLEDRSRHTYVIGKTGMGKSTLLENMAVQDIQSGEGLCFIDPHGGTAEKLLNYIPENRVKDVLYFAPFDMQYPISFNVLENVDADKRHLVVAGLMSTFEKIWVDAWSARMAYILQNTIAALLEFPGATLLGVNRMYIDKEYRKNVVAKITDSSVRSFWVGEYAKYTDRYAQEATPAIQNKIGQFAANALVRNVIGQAESSFNIRELMDDKKIFIVNLSKGRVGEGNANLLGSMLITKVYLAAMSRADSSSVGLRNLPPFYLYVDEFQNFANKSFADILSEARKYKLALTIAHQYIEQMEDEVRAAVFGNVGTMMAFRVGAYDAEVLEKEFAPVFEADDIVNLGKYQLYLKLMIDGVSSQPFSGVGMPPIPEPAVSHGGQAIAYSRAQYSRPREEVETEITDWVDRKYEDPEKDAKDAARAERRKVRDEEAAKENKRQPRERMASSGPRSTSSRPDSRGPRTQAPNTSNRNSKYPPRNNTYQGSAPRTDAPQKRSMPPRPAPKPKMEDGEGLRSLLSNMTKPEQKKESTVADIKTTQPKVPVGNQRKVPQPPKFVPRKDDGKSITDEGKQELRGLLSSLNKGGVKSETQVKKPTPKPQPQVQKNIPPQKPTSPTQQQKQAPVPQKPEPVREVVPQSVKTPQKVQPTPPVTPAPKQPDTPVPPKQKPEPKPKEISNEKLEKILQVEKPNL